jgi:spore cortex biosynthesis protein YabQ
LDSLVSQAHAFAATIVTGMAAGFCYDYYRVVRAVFRLKKMGTCLGDIIFWLVATALVFFLLLLGNRGEMRLYVLAGLGLGALIYHCLLSKYVSRLVRFKFFLFHKTWELLVKLTLFLWMVALFPFRLVILVLSCPLVFVRRSLKKAGRKLRAAFYNLAGRRVERGVAGIRARLSFLVFWRKKKEE